MVWVAFITGMFVGAFIGVVVTSLCVMARMSNEMPDIEDVEPQS